VSRSLFMACVTARPSWAVAPGGLDEFPDGPAGLVLDPTADRERHEDDGQVGFDPVPGAVVDGPGLRRACKAPGARGVAFAGAGNTAYAVATSTGAILWSYHDTNSGSDF
jgi:hypothetical protein